VWWASGETLDLCYARDGVYPAYCGDVPSEVQISVCTTCHGDGMFTMSWAFGQFNTTGGYDWTSVNVLLPVGLSPRGDVAVGAYGFTVNAAAPSAPQADYLPTGARRGDVLSHPPFHHHHSRQVLMDPSNSGEFKSLAGDNGYCSSDPEGNSCSFIDLLSNGYSLPTARVNSTFPISLIGLINDVRPTGSPPLEWVMNFTLTFADLKTTVLEPLSQVTLGHAFTIHSLFGTIPVPAAEDSFIAYEGHWGFDGTLLTDRQLGAHAHSHNNKFWASYLIAASPAELGLDRPPFFSTTGCDAVPTAQAGFATQFDMLTWLMSRSPSSFSLTAPDSRLICRATATNAPVGRFFYDRQSIVDCNAKLLNVRRGETYTVLSFFGPRPEAFNPVAMDASSSFFPEHTSWTFMMSLGSPAPAYEVQTSDWLLNNGTVDTSRCRGHAVINAATGMDKP